MGGGLRAVGVGAGACKSRERCLGRLVHHARAKRVLLRWRQTWPTGAQRLQLPRVARGASERPDAPAGFSAVVPGRAALGDRSFHDRQRVVAKQPDVLLALSMSYVSPGA